MGERGKGERVEVQFEAALEYIEGDAHEEGPMILAGSALAMLITAVAWDAATAANAPAAPAPPASYAAVPQDTIPRVGEYRVYTGSGELVTLDSIVAAMADEDVVFIGESHNDLTGHLIEVELLTRAFTAYSRAYTDEDESRDVTLSLEMFERDVQYVLDEYLQDLITEDQFRKSSRPWTEYETDYRPLIEFAKQEGLGVIAANAPRRYANMVTRRGRDALLELSSHALATLPPLPYGIPSTAYEEQWRQAMLPRLLSKIL